MKTQIRRGTHDALLGYTPTQGDIVFDTSLKTLRTYNGTTAGGASTGPNIALQGPKEVPQGETATYTIVGDAFSTYRVEAGLGTVTLDGMTVTYTAPAGGETDTLTVYRNDAGSQYVVGLLKVGLVGAGTQLSSAPLTRQEHVAVVINGKMYVHGGINGPGAVMSDLWVYDPATDGWTQLTAGPTARYQHMAVAIDNKMYVFGGQTGSSMLSELWVYDPATDTWTQLPNAPYASYRAASAAINGKMYIYGGYTSSGSTGILYEYDVASGVWTQLASGAVRYEHAAAAVGGKFYSFGGYDGFNRTNSLAVFDPATNAWTYLASGATAREYHTAVAVGELLYIHGGWDANKVRLNDLWEYNPAGDTWASIGSVATGRTNATTVAIDGAIYLTGGHNGASYLNDLWRIN